MIEDGYPIFDKNEWKAVPGAQAGAFVLDKYLGNGYWAGHCLACGNPYAEKREDNLRIGATGGIVYSTGRRYNGTRSCGCKQGKQFKKANTAGVIHEDLTGQILNGWKLIEKTFMKDSNRSELYLCQSTIRPAFYDLLSTRHLKDGYVAQAKLANNLSLNEQKILKLLKENNIHGKMQSSFIDCKDKCLLPFDFFIENKYIIEYDGEQHFKPIDFFGGEKYFNVQRAHDLIKNKYCFDNNTPIIRIPYDVEYTLDDLKLETTRFLLTKENEKEYYESRK